MLLCLDELLVDWLNVIEAKDNIFVPFRYQKVADLLAYETFKYSALRRMQFCS